MRSTLDIIIAVQESQPATEEELRTCIVAMAAFDYFTSSNLAKLVEAIDSGKQVRIDIYKSESKKWAETKFCAQKKPMIEWVGEDNMPGNPEYEARRKMFKGIAKAATGLDL